MDTLALLVSGVMLILVVRPAIRTGDAGLIALSVGLAAEWQAHLSCVLAIFRVRLGLSPFFLRLVLWSFVGSEPAAVVLYLVAVVYLARANLRETK